MLDQGKKRADDLTFWENESLSAAELTLLGLIMNKNDIIENVAEEFELTKVFARELIDNIFDTIATTAAKGEEVSIFGFGKFKLVERKARKGRNPQTGEAIKIAASNSMKFEPASGLKESLNKKRRSRK
jgi:DNA-binding protein HU-beta